MGEHKPPAAMRGFCLACPNEAPTERSGVYFFHMPKPFDHQQIAKWFFLLLFAGVAMLFWQVIAPFATVLITAGIVAILMAPIDRKIREWVGHEKLSAFIVVVLVLAIIIIPLATFALVAADQAVEIVQETVGDPAWMRSLDIRSLPFVSSLPPILVAQLLHMNVPELLRNVASWTAQNIGTLFAGTAEIALKTFLFFVSLYFFLVDRERIKKEIIILSPLKTSIDNALTERLILTVRGVVFGSLIVAVIQGIVAAIGLSLFGVPGALIWAGLVVIAAQVPMLGTSVIMLPAVVYLFLSGHMTASLGLFLWSMIAVGLVDNLAAPFILGKRTRMHALLMLLSMLGGLSAFGPIGFILGPTILAAFLVLLELYKAGILEKTK